MENDIRMIFEDLAGAMRENTKVFSELLKESEERITKTNEMICKLADVVSGINQHQDRLLHEYASHVNALASARDALIGQNKELTSMVARSQHDLARERERYENLLQTLVSLAKGSQTINVK